MKRKVLWIVASVVAAALIVTIVIVVVRGTGRNAVPTPKPSSPTPSATPSPTPTPTPTAPPTPAQLKLMFDRTQYSIDDPTSIWVVVDKLRPMNPPSFAPPDLVSVPVPHVHAPLMRAEASAAVVAMFAAYTSETGLKMQSQSAYRSYAAQQSVYGGNDTLTARPGYSEHQTGLAIDISALPAKCSLATCFADTPQGQWLAANAYKWGFILRYPNGLTDITGYQFEPWHYRYVGVPLATVMHDTGIPTLEQFFDLPPAPAYAG
ncbi:MAG TPA: M15 family metallopeptidase [Pseudolysinimonas sp.]|nr:M15 family metallopeptidase [Pseudolysinimonas sp.]